MTISKNKVVGVRYTLRNERGEVLEDAMNGAPVYYLHGSPGISLQLQQQLEGAAQGGHKEVILLALTGSNIEQRIYNVVIDEVRPALEEEIILGYPILANNTICNDDCDCYAPNDDQQPKK